MKTIPPDANPPLRLLMSMQRVFEESQPEWLIRAPGREMWLAATPLTDSLEYMLVNEDFDSSVTFSHRSAKSKQTVLKRPLPIWARYPAGVIATLGDAGMDIPGFQAVMLGDEPSGPRYNFGMGVVFAAFCHELVEKPYKPASLTEIVERVRRMYVEG